MESNNIIITELLLISLVDMSRNMIGLVMTIATDNVKAKMIIVLRTSGGNNNKLSQSNSLC